MNHQYTKKANRDSTELVEVRLRRFEMQRFLHLRNLRCYLQTSRSFDELLCGKKSLDLSSEHHNFPSKSSIPNLPQGACLAQEVGDVGGETSGTARG
jgi:hypothetical protein